METTDVDPLAGVKAGDERRPEFVPDPDSTCDAEGLDERDLAAGPPYWPWLCTREVGHPGQHIACTSSGPVAFVWQRGGAS